MNDVRARVLQEVDGLTDAMVGELQRVVRIPSISGTAEENSAQAHMASLFSSTGLDIDHWQIDLDEMPRRADFPGMEVRRDEAWGLVARLPGTGADDGATLMLNGHIDVVPQGDREAWTCLLYTSPSPRDS